MALKPKIYFVFKEGSYGVQGINISAAKIVVSFPYIDMGFYTTTGITPNIRFFINHNIDYSRFPLIMDEQNRYIKEKVVEYIVVRQPASDDIENLKIPFLFDYYQLIESEKQEFENNNFYYYLFKRNN